MEQEQGKFRPSTSMGSILLLHVTTIKVESSREATLVAAAFTQALQRAESMMPRVSESTNQSRTVMRTSG